MPTDPSPIINIGYNAVREIERSPSFDPDKGHQTVIIYEGERLELESYFAQNFGTLWAQTIRPYKGPVYRGQVTIGGLPGGQQTPAVDTWERHVEFIQEDLRRNPRIQEYFAFDYRPLSEQYEIAKDAKKNKINPSTLPGGAQLFYRMMSRGEEAYELTRLVIIRRRTIPIGFTSPRVPTSRQFVYNTTSYVTTFLVPAFVQALLPATPTLTPNETAWGWKIRQDTSRLIPYYRKTEEVMAWTFAAWSTILYEHI